MVTPRTSRPSSSSLMSPHRRRRSPTPCALWRPTVAPRGSSGSLARAAALGPHVSVPQASVTGAAVGVLPLPAPSVPRLAQLLALLVGHRLGALPAQLLPFATPVHPPLAQLVEPLGIGLRPAGRPRSRTRGVGLGTLRRGARSVRRGPNLLPRLGSRR